MPAKGDPFTQPEITEALLALIAWAGNVAAACRWLKSEGKRAPDQRTLAHWSRTTHLEEYDELREKYSAKLEADLAHEMRDVARLALATERLAIEQAHARLKKGEDQDPGRTAANLARVAQSSTDKLMTLTSRPTSITENRDVYAILRSLVASGVLVPPDEEPAQIEEATTA